MPPYSNQIAMAKPCDGKISTMKSSQDNSVQRFDPARFLDSDATIAAYLTAALEDGDATVLAAALGAVAKAKGMTTIAEGSGLTRESLYKALRPDAQPRFDTIVRVLSAVGLQVKITPIKKKRGGKVHAEHAPA